MTRARDVATQGGLTLIGTQTLSAASGGIFTGLTADTKYRVTGNVYGSVSGTYMRFNARENSTNKNSGYYGASYRALYNNTSGMHYYSSNATLFTIFNYHTSIETPSIFSADIYLSPSRQSMTIHGTAYDYYTNGSFFFGCENHTMTACNGFSFFTDNGTMSGSISLYKYNV